MFWSGNYIAVRELHALLKEENVTLTQVLESDDILQECQADNKSLIQFLIRPEILAELITLITEEPSKDVELQSQYRHACVACEVLTSHIGMLSDRLSADTVQMNRLCDFINQEPPLNPLLASFFSKTVEMLLERSPKQDWYLYHIVCLRVLDFFKSRRDFLPNLLRHLATSAVADTFKYFIRLDDLFNKVVMEWLEEHQFLESLVQILCGTYVPEELQPCVIPKESKSEQSNAERPPEEDNGNKPMDQSVKTNNDVNHTGDNGTEYKEDKEASSDGYGSGTGSEAEGVRADRMRAVASYNAAALLCDIINEQCAGETCTTRPQTGALLMSRLKSEETVSLQLQSMFTSPLPFRRHALVNGSRVLLALLSQEPVQSAVELAAAPHLPLLHQALLQDPTAGVGAVRLHIATLVAALAVSEVREVATTLVTLGTLGTLVDMFFRYPHNNFLHAAVCSAVRGALTNHPYRLHYARHLVIECDLMARLMDAFEENDNDLRPPSVRPGYMGHAVVMARRLQKELDPDLLQQLNVAPHLVDRWTEFLERTLQPLAHQHDTPLGGCYPSDTVYEVDNFAETVAANYEFNELSEGGADGLDHYRADITTDLEGMTSADTALPDPEEYAKAMNAFLQMVDDERLFCDNIVWEDGEARGEDAHRVLAAVSPWEAAGSGEGSAPTEGWARFGETESGAEGGAETEGTSGTDRPETEDPTEGTSHESMERLLDRLHIESETSAEEQQLASNLLNAMSSLSADLIANIVNANVRPEGPVALEGPTVPEAPTIPEPPTLSEAPTIPEPPTVLEAPTIPETPTLPKTPTVPEPPTVPAAPTAPEDSVATETPAAPTVPKAPTVAEAPAAPDAPTSPEAPDATHR